MSAQHLCTASTSSWSIVHLYLFVYKVNKLTTCTFFRCCLFCILSALTEWLAAFVCDYWAGMFITDIMFQYIIMLKLNDIALNDKSSQSYEASLAIWDHTVLPSTQHKWTRPTRQAGTRFTCPGGMEGWVDLGDLLHTEMVNPPTDGRPSKY